MHPLNNLVLVINLGGPLKVFFTSQNDEEIPNGGTTNGYDAETTGKVKKWRIENSWGEDRNEKGFISMTTEWYVITKTILK